ncbi:MAG: tetratricopeptide repeat protein [Candidatus Odinarchaeum yellowstonii]|uniref:Tetratricopeptide repeat protein n=1 Tax=Odinarchaeota yellowstonii (strain LCB_4) TaxID=1841599 RepID=A0AAF0IBX0_ODILC|nr:MAG: tetratricopeptide repeat protein [Candidatus Odinarchaeum yellowstonii]
MSEDKLLQEAVQLLKQEKYRDLIKLYEGNQLLEALDYRHFRILAISYIQTLQYDEALKAFEKCIQKYPKIEERDQVIVEPLYLLAHKLLKNRQYKEFEKARDLLLSFNPDYYFFRSLIWKLKNFREMDKRGLFDQAISVINHVLEGENYLRSDTERERAREIWQEKCFTHLQKALEISGDLPFILEELGLLHILILDFEEAEKYLRKAYFMNPGCETILYHLGLLNEKKGFYEEALKYYKEALELDPSYELCATHIRLCNAKILLTNAVNEHRRGDLESAIIKYRAILELNPGDIEVLNKLRKAVKQYISKTILKVKEYISNQRFSEAESLLSKLVEEYPSEAEIKNMYYELAERLHQHDVIKQIVFRRERERDDSLILINALEVLRNKRLKLDDKINTLVEEFSKLSENLQFEILDKIKTLKTPSNNIEGSLDELITGELNRLKCSDSNLIPEVIDPGELPVYLALTIDLKAKIKNFIKKFRNWYSGIPVTVKYDYNAGTIVQKSDYIDCKAALLVDKLLEGPAAYQIWLKSDGSFTILKTQSYIEEQPLPNQRIGVWSFKIEDAGLHNRLIQLHRYEIKNIVENNS